MRNASKSIYDPISFSSMSSDIEQRKRMLDTLAAERTRILDNLNMANLMREKSLNKLKYYH